MEEFLNYLKNNGISKLHQEIVLNFIKKDIIRTDIIEAYKKFKTYKNLMHNLDIKFENYFNNKMDEDEINKGIEKFSDAVYDNILKNKARKLMKSVFSNKYKNLFYDGIEQSFVTLVEEGFKREDLQKLLTKKLSAIKTQEDLKNSIENILDSNINWSIDYIESKIKNNELNAKIVYSENNECIVEINNFKESSVLGTNMWCVVRDPDMFDQYENDLLRFYFKYDFNKPVFDVFSMQALLVDKEKKINSIYNKDDSLLTLSEEKKEEYYSKYKDSLKKFDEKKTKNIINRVINNDKISFRLRQLEHFKNNEEFFKLIEKLKSSLYNKLSDVDKKYFTTSLFEKHNIKYLDNEAFTEGMDLILKTSNLTNEEKITILHSENIKKLRDNFENLDTPLLSHIYAMSSRYLQNKYEYLEILEKDNYLNEKEMDRLLKTSLRFPNPEVLMYALKKEHLKEDVLSILEKNENKVFKDLQNMLYKKEFLTKLSSDDKFYASFKVIKDFFNANNEINLIKVLIESGLSTGLDPNETNISKILKILLKDDSILKNEKINDIFKRELRYGMNGCDLDVLNEIIISDKYQHRLFAEKVLKSANYEMEDGLNRLIEKPNLLKFIKEDEEIKEILLSQPVLLSIENEHEYDIIKKLFKDPKELDNKIIVMCEENKIDNIDFHYFKKDILPIAKKNISKSIKNI